MGKDKNIFGNIDHYVIITYVLLVAIGWINIYAAVLNNEHSNIVDMSQKYGMQLLWIGAAFVIALIILLLDSKIYSVFAIPIYLIIMLLLASVLFVGVEINGSKSWLAFGNIRLQPAELAKVATALALAKVMGNYGFKLNDKKNILRILLIFAIPIMLILMQKDTGSALVFSSFAIMLYREGLNGWLVLSAVFMAVLFIISFVLTPLEVVILIASISFIIYAFYTKKMGKTIKAAIVLTISCLLLLFATSKLKLDVEQHIVIVVGLVVFSAVAIYLNRKKLKPLLISILFFFASISVSFSVDYIFDNILKQHQKDRIENLLGIKIDLQGTGYNVHQSKIAIGSGGFLGKGFLQGTQTKLNFVPEQSTDFIFCTVGEEWGFIGCTVLIFLYVFLLYRIVIIAERQKYAFARIYAYCVVGILFFHFAANIGMTIGLMPVIGIPLPFLSYGGSSLWAFTVLLFVLLKLDSKK